MLTGGKFTGNAGCDDFDVSPAAWNTIPMVSSHERHHWIVFTGLPTPPLRMRYLPILPSLPNRCEAGETVLCVGAIDSGKPRRTAQSHFTRFRGVAIRGAVG